MSFRDELLDGERRRIALAETYHELRAVDDTDTACTTFLFAGGVKLVLPIEAMIQQITLPGSFLRFIGVAEALGAIGLILPGLLGIRRELPCLAASGLVVIMVGATVVTLAAAASPALMPFAVGVLLLFAAYGRWSTLAVASGIEGPADFVPRSTN